MKVLVVAMVPGACGVAEAVRLSNELWNSAHQGPADAK